jgi:hypothetical protein
MQDTATAVDFFVTNIGSGFVSNWYDDAASWRIGTASALTGTSYTERMRIDSSGRLLIGTTAEISAAAPSIQLVDTDNSAKLVLGRDDSSVSTGDALGKIEMWGNDGGTYQMCASIAAEADGDHANDDKPTRLVFSTTGDGASSVTERMQIGSAGQLGIGGENYGTSGQVIKSNGNSSAPTWGNTHSFMFYGEQDATQTISTGTYTAIVNLGTNAINVGDSSIAVWDEDVGTLTIGASGAGIWFLSMGVGIDDLKDKDYIQCAVAKNGDATDIDTRLSTYGRSWNGSSDDQVVVANVSCMVDLSADDVVRFYIKHNEGTNEHTEENRTFAMGYKIN